MRQPDKHGDAKVARGLGEIAVDLSRLQEGATLDQQAGDWVMLLCGWMARLGVPPDGAGALVGALAADVLDAYPAHVRFREDLLAKMRATASGGAPQ